MKIALDPYMFRTTPLLELPALVADLGYEHIELSPREDFIPFFRHPRVDTATIKAFRKALEAAGVEVASLLPLFRWSGPDEDEREAAVRYWKRSIEIAVELGVTVMNSEFNGRPEQAEPVRGACSGGRWRSCCRSSSARGSALALEPHPDDFVEDGKAAVDMVRGIDSPSGLVPVLRAAHVPQGGDVAGIMEHAGPTRDPSSTWRTRSTTVPRRACATSSTRRARRPAIHQHLDIGQGEVDWDAFFGTLGASCASTAS